MMTVDVELGQEYFQMTIYEYGTENDKIFLFIATAALEPYWAFQKQAEALGNEYHVYAVSSEESQNPASDNSVLETTNQESSIEETSGIVSNSDIIVESSQYSEKSSEISDSSQEVLSTEEAMALIPSHSREEWKAIETISKDDIVCYARFINDRLEKYKPGDIVGIVGQIENQDVIYYYISNTSVGAVPMQDLEFLPKDYVLKDGERIVN